MGELWVDSPQTWPSRRRSRSRTSFLKAIAPQQHIFFDTKYIIMKQSTHSNYIFVFFFGLNSDAIYILMFWVNAGTLSLYHTGDPFSQLIYQGLFSHDQVSSGKFLAFFNLWRNLHMFLDTMEPRTENKNLSLETNCFDNLDSDMLNNCLNCP